MLGCSSQKARVEEIDTDQYFYSSIGGKRVETKVYPNKLFYTPNFRSPEKKLFNITNHHGQKA